MNLCIILTGQIRNFFDARIVDSFIHMIQLSKLSYSNILIICVVSGNYDKKRLEELFDTLRIKSLILTYDIDEYTNLMKVKQNNVKYMELRKKYMQNTNNLALAEIADPNLNASLFIQFHQIKKGLEYMLFVERNTNIQYDIIMKSRFDIRMKDMFYPHMPNDLLHKICFNDEILRSFTNTLHSLQIEFDIHKVVNYIDGCTIEQPKCRVDNKLLTISFGGMYAYNSKSITNILHGRDNILYAFNDFIIFAKRDIMLKFIHIFDDCAQKESNFPLPHFYALEAQLYLFCMNNDIDILMYTELNDDGFGYKYGPG